MEELERTFLVKFLPEGLFDVPYKEIVDVYIPITSAHPCMRVRKNGDRYEITKKQPIESEDISRQHESTIPLEAGEYEALVAIPGSRISKRRCYYPFQDGVCEVDVFTGNLVGLVLVDIEFSSVEGKAECEMPSFCLAEVTQESVFAGGMLAGKSYEDIEGDLARFGYQKINV